MPRSRSRSRSRGGQPARRRTAPPRLSLSRRQPVKKSREVRRRRSPSRANNYTQSYKDRDRNWQRKFDEKNKELTDCQTQLASVGLEFKDSKDKVSELQASNKHQSAMLAVYAQNERESDKRFERLNEENVRLRISINNLITNREKMYKQLQFEIQEWPRSLQSQSSSNTQNSSPEMLTATRAPIHAKARGTPSDDEDDASSVSESSPRGEVPAPRLQQAPGEAQHQPEQTAQNVDRGLSAETLPMSPRAAPPTNSPARAPEEAPTDMPEPTTQPLVFEPPEGQQAVSAVIQ